MTAPTKVVIFGDQDFAELAHQYFTYDSEYEVAGFCVDEAYRSHDTFCGLPVVSFETIEKHFPPIDHALFAAIVYGKLNRLREDVCIRAKAKGYILASYISSRAFVWRNVSLGEHCFIFEDNTLQPFVTVGNNVVMWSGNHIGHHSRIGHNVFITSHVVISGWCDIGDYTFIGVNSTLSNNTHVGSDTWISHGSVVSGDIPPHRLIKPHSSEIVELNERVLFRSLGKAARSKRRPYNPPRTAA